MYIYVDIVHTVTYAQKSSTLKFVARKYEGRRQEEKTQVNEITLITLS